MHDRRKSLENGLCFELCPKGAADNEEHEPVLLRKLQVDLDEEGSGREGSNFLEGGVKGPVVEDCDMASLYWTTSYSSSSMERLVGMHLPMQEPILGHFWNGD